MTFDREEVLELLRAVHPQVVWDMAVTDAEYNDAEELVPPRIVLIANIVLHGSCEVAQEDGTVTPADWYEHAQKLLAEIGFGV